MASKWIICFSFKKKLNKLFIDPLKKYPCLALHLSQSSLYINPIIINSYKLSLSLYYINTYEYFEFGSDPFKNYLQLFL